MFCLEGRIISLMVNPALIVPLCNMADITVKLSIGLETLVPISVLPQREMEVINIVDMFNITDKK